MNRIEEPEYMAGRREYFRSVDAAANTVAAKLRSDMNNQSLRADLTHRIRVMDHLRGMPWGAP